MASTTSSSSPFATRCAGGDPDRRHPARHRGLERAGVVPVRGWRALALLRERVGDAVPGEVDGRAVAGEVEGPGTRALPDHEDARPRGLEGEAELPAVHAHLERPSRASRTSTSKLSSPQRRRISAPPPGATARGSPTGRAPTGALRREPLPLRPRAAATAAIASSGGQGLGTSSDEVLLDEAGVQLSRRERGVLDDRPQTGEVGDDPEDHGAPEGVAHPLDRLRAVLAPGDDLREQRVVVDGHLRARVEARVHADARPLGLREVEDASRGRAGRRCSGSSA